MADFDGGAFHRTQPITLEHVQAVLRRVSGIDVTLTKRKLAATWTDRAFPATVYREERVLLAGDAAHTHSPLGGQGLNLGLGDAMNLGWKLAATIPGDAPAGLLDSRGTHALQAIIRDLIDTSDGATYFAERVWGVSLRYDLGGSHPLVGRSVPDFELLDGTKIGELLRDGKGLFLDFDLRAPLRALASRWDRRINYVAGDVKDRLGLSAALVQPDGFVAWATDVAPDEQEIAEAASHWFGET